MRATRNRDGERPQRNNHRLVPAENFQLLANLDDVLEALFGELP